MCHVSRRGRFWAEICSCGHARNISEEDSEEEGDEGRVLTTYTRNLRNKPLTINKKEVSFKISVGVSSIERNEYEKAIAWCSTRIKTRMSYWARACTECKVHLSGFEHPLQALPDSGSEVNIVSMLAYNEGQ